MTRLALVLIARDEACCIAGVPTSAASEVDEMIVLDTGSRDAPAAWRSQQDSNLQPPA
jgi:hypothetical protein